MWLCSCVTFSCACVGMTMIAVAMIQKMAKRNFIFTSLRRHRSGPVLYRDLSVNTDAALQEVALKISEQLNSLIWFRDDHIHCIRHENGKTYVANYDCSSFLRASSTCERC